MTPGEHTLDVEYDFVAIVDGLPRSERSKWRLSKKLADYLGGKGVHQETAECRNRADTAVAFAHFLGHAREGRKFPMHFVCHGNAHGLELRATGEFIRWSELTEDLRKMNDAMGGQLTVNMSSCRGLHGVKIVSGEGGLPFFGLVGPKEDIQVETAQRVNRMYYDLQLGGMRVDEAVQEVNTSEGRELLYCISAGFYQNILRLKKDNGTGFKRSF